MSAAIHVHIDFDGPESEAIRYAFLVLLGGLVAPVVFHKVKPLSVSSDAMLITYTQSPIGSVQGKHLVIYATHRLWNHYGTAASLPSSPLPRVPLGSLGVQPNARLQDPLILAYVGEMGPLHTADRRVGHSASDVSVVTGADVVASTFFWMTRYEESLISERDEFGRVPQERLLAIGESFTQRPLVDEYCELVRIWLKMLGSEPIRITSQFRVAVTHDVDSGIDVNGVWRHANQGLRTLYRELVRQRRPGTGFLGVGQWMLRALRITNEATLFRDIVRLDAEFGFVAFFFLMANGTHERDASYDIQSDAAGAVIRAIQEAGGGIGLHVGLNAHEIPNQLRSEWERLYSVCQARPVARSHYLAFFAPATWRQLVNLGFTVDSTLGFSRHTGFRAGTCRAFRPFDLDRLQVLPLWELPMTVMDVNLFNERASNADRVATVENLAACVRAHEGCLVLNWHNVNFFGHYLDVYRSILCGLRGAQAVSPDNLGAPDAAVIW